VRFFENERAFSTWTLREARRRGWRAAQMENMRVVRTPNGPRAIPAKDIAGLPDLLLVHPKLGLVWAELKMDGAKPPSPEQVEWLVALREAREAVYVWRPSDQDEILDVLDGRTVGLFQMAGI
jgi:hypothetical protein